MSAVFVYKQPSLFYKSAKSSPTIDERQNPAVLDFVAIVWKPARLRVCDIFMNRVKIFHTCNYIDNIPTTEAELHLGTSNSLDFPSHNSLRISHKYDIEPQPLWKSSSQALRQRFSCKTLYLLRTVHFD